MNLEHLKSYDNPKIACKHAINIGQRQPEYEPKIMKDPESAYRYAYFVLGCRWSDIFPPESESTIMKDPKWAYMYAKDVIRGRWLAAEPYIMKDPKWSDDYTMFVLDRNWDLWGK